MSRSPVVENYAETLMELGVREGQAREYGAALSELVGLMESREEMRRFLDTPRVEPDEKRRALRTALSGRVPETFIRFLLVVLDKGRQRLLPEIEAAYRDLLDEREGRVHASVTLAREPDESLREEIRRGLQEAFDREVVLHFQEDERLLGGLVVKIGDRVMDGSVQRRLEDMRRQLVRGPRGDRSPKAGRA